MLLKKEKNKIVEELDECINNVELSKDDIQIVPSHQFEMISNEKLPNDAISVVIKSIPETIISVYNMTLKDACSDEDNIVNVSYSHDLFFLSKAANDYYEKNKAEVDNKLSQAIEIIFWEACKSAVVEEDNTDDVI